MNDNPMEHKSRCEIQEITSAIRLLRHNAKRLRRELEAAEREIEELEARRWQLVLTQ